MQGQGADKGRALGKEICRAGSNAGWPQLQAYHIEKKREPQIGVPVVVRHQRFMGRNTTGPKLERRRENGLSGDTSAKGRACRVWEKGGAGGEEEGRVR